jgi:hypothetical protein
MNLDHTPHPLLEDHYHIRDLINAQERRAADRQYHRDRIKEQEDRNGIIADAKPVTLTEFWCDECHLDFKGEAVKQIEDDWTNPKQQIAFYKTKCFKQHWCIRLITDRHMDGFFQKSRRVAADRGNHAIDTLQPFETGFNMVYGKK